MRDIKVVLNGDYHDVTLGDLKEALDGTSGNDRVLAFTSPTGTGKTRMVCHRAHGEFHKVLLAVPTVTVAAQTSEDYGVQAIHGNVESFVINEDTNTVVTTYDGIRRFVTACERSGISLSDWTLCVDEAHHLVTSCGFRGKAVQYMFDRYSDFSEVFLMSATQRDQPCIIPSVHFEVVAQTVTPIDLYYSQSTDYLAMAEVELASEDNEFIIMVVNNKSQIAAMAQVASQKFKVAIMTSDKKGTQEYNDVLSGEYKPQILFCTSVLYDGVNINPRRHSIIVTEHTNIIAKELVQLSSRNRGWGKGMIKPNRAIICHPDAPNFRRSEAGKTVDEKFKEVEAYCDLLRPLHSHLVAVGESEQSINKLLEIRYSKHVSFETDESGRVVITPLMSACIASVEDRNREFYTMGDMIAECEEYAIHFKGEIEYPETELKQLVKHNAIIAKRTLEENVKTAVKGFSEVCVKGKGDIDEFLEILSPQESANHHKKVITTVARLAVARRKMMKDDEYNPAFFAEMIKSEGDTMAKAGLLNKRLEIHRLLDLAINKGEGRNRPDVATVLTIFKAYRKGDQFTNEELKTDFPMFSYSKLSELILPKSPLAALKLIFTIKRKTEGNGDDKRNFYEITDNSNLFERMREFEVKA